MLYFCPFQRYFMLGINNFVIVVVVNALSAEDKKDNNFFDKFKTVRLAALRTINRDIQGNYHSRSDIQKQAYIPDRLKTVKDAYALTGTKFDTHSAWRNGKLLALSDSVSSNDEIILIKDGLDVSQAIKEASRHRILPDRKGS